MNQHLNIRARLKRALRNDQKIYSAWETFRKFRWFTLAIVILLPIYPSLSVLGSDYQAMAGDYDESTIITAYNGDPNTDGWYVNKNGFVSTDFDVSKPILSTNTGEQLVVKTKYENTAQSYVVQNGDTLSKIAARYGITTDTILWANDLSPGDALKLGTILKIPPVSGVIHTVVSGDTISEIAAHYWVDADDIVRVNNLWDAASIRKGMDLIIPGAAKKIQKSSHTEEVAKSNAKKSPENNGIRPTPIQEVLDKGSGLKSRYLVKYTGLSRGFAWGNCTWYVAQNKSITWRGNANRWMSNAKAAWVKTGQTPVPGAIIQFSGRWYNRYYGHVGIVVDVTDDYVILKDMNYRSINEVTIRKVPKDDSTIDGYIYVD